MIQYQTTAYGIGMTNLYTTGFFREALYSPPLVVPNILSAAIISFLIEPKSSM